jgi:ribulose kinase
MAITGVDGGTGSARAGLSTPDGTMLAQASRQFLVRRPRPGFVQQFKADAWNAVCFSVGEVVAATGAVEICGLGWDAT